ncbi:hypothetical protein GCM10023347_25150 [Streptomyces chumphonensis]|uniref:SDR family NAD(P)-dependent oxidoreductase n=1 Tax=Streptomyces chumphonensis TaxID=1214925 RepID=A0A927EVG7_9ACTN|nr:SDR family NAD(P)-dependent oxidoreductase [Streptomyces chumphonensis]MBD3929993.1 SDR family NAD(P)-dependent oxidoreductase [Streptomyces chumphonensis]
MNPHLVTGTLTVTPEEVRAFAEASGDASPLHVDDAYARRTPFGRPVAHGVLCVLKLFAAGPARPGLRVSSLTARFRGPVTPGQRYAWSAEDAAPEDAAAGAGPDGPVEGAAPPRRLVLRLRDGRRDLIEVLATVEPGTLREAPARPARSRLRRTAAGTPWDGLAPGQAVGAAYRPDWPALSALADRLGLAERALDAEHLAVLSWASQLAGMEAPGRAALVSGLDLDAEPAPRRSAFRARGEITEVDERYRQLRLRGEVTAGHLRARVGLRVHVRGEGSAPSVDLLRTRLGCGPGPGPLVGRTAFVAGGSRGLGAAVAAALVLSGARVHVAFRDSTAEAEELRAALGADGERLVLHRGDVGDPRWCAETRRRIVESEGPVRLLVLNAGPPAQALDLHPDAVARAAAHVEAALRLAHAPLAAFAEDVAAGDGQVVAVSSAYAASPPRGLSHYSAAKRAVEGLVTAAVTEHPGLSGLLVRPPRLATTFADSVTAAEEALPVETAAAVIVRRMVAGGAPGATEVVDVFAPSVAEPAPAGTAADPDREPSAPAEGPAARAGAALAVAATFTTEPLREGLEFWARRLGLEVSVRLSPYGQVFQELLDPAGGFAGNVGGCNVVLLRFEDWPRGAGGVRTAEEFAAAVTTAARRDAVPLVVMVCPPSPTAADRRAEELSSLEARVRTALEGVRGVHLVSGPDWRAPYSVPRHHDAAREEHAHIPYTPTACTVLATAVARTAHSLLAPPFKVLVLDCDNTLWRGVCGEDGADGVEIGPAHRRLQQWAVERHAEGVLVCLCSKNSDEDVDAVFAHRPDMPLRPEHVAARRVDWNPKPGNIRALAEELGLGTDAFVFLDDNPVEVAAVRAELPEVLALTLPTDVARWPDFLDRLWAFDKAEVTDEDRRRTVMYRAGRERAALREATATLSEFIGGLDLRVDVRQATPEQLARAAQLTQRTNQFNLAPTRRTESQLGALSAEGARCWVAEVTDRFGDYGLVGVAITRAGADGDGDTATLDTFLLSCRVLGRGVEHAFLAAVASAVEEHDGCRHLTAVHRPTARNTPVRTFFDAVLGHRASPAPTEGEVVYHAPLAEVARVAFRPEDAPDPATGDTVAWAPRPAPAASSAGGTARLDALADLAGVLVDAEVLHRAVTGDPEPPAARAADAADPAAGVVAPHAWAEALDRVCGVLARPGRRTGARLGPDTTVESLRLESLEIVDATVALEEHFGRLPTTLFFEHRTLGDVARAVLPPAARTPGPTGPAEPAAPAPPRTPASAPDAGDGAAPGAPATAAEDAEAAEDAIAVVGVAGRYPGAADLDQLWHNLVAGAESLGDATRRWGRADLVDPDGGPGRTYTAAAGLLDDVDAFDALFFGLAPSEAETMDPQQRLFLQTAYHALEDAGHTAASLGRDVGVYVASMGPDHAVLSANAALDGLSRYPNSDIYQIANRVSYFLDFTGPSIAVDTACSGSGVALQLACDALRAGTVSAAIAGGVNVILHPARRIQYAQLGMLSPTGRCRPFGAGADGMVTSEGVGAVLLRPLRDALADGDHIHGVIKAVTTNSGGRTSGFTVPSPAAQAELIGAALRRAGTDPATIGYVEAHGTGTALGDPIEIRGLTAAFGSPGPDGAIPVGSIKGNIGHTEAAAALAGLTKVLLQLRHGTLVPSLHSERLNPAIDFDTGLFQVQREAAAWRSGRAGAPRRASVSSFGAGGVNVHLVVEEPPSTGTGAPGDAGPERPELVVLSAREDATLREVCLRLAAWLRGPGADRDPADVAYTLREGRERHAVRLAFPVRDRRHLRDVLDALTASGRTVEEAARELNGVAFERSGAGRDLADLLDGGPETTGLLRGLAERGDLLKLGRLWCAGARCDWSAVLPATGRRRVPLPGYPFARTRHRLPAAETAPARADRARPDEAPADASPLAYYTPRWTTTHPAPEERPVTRATVVAIGGPRDWSEGADHHAADPDDLPGVPGELIVVDRRGLDDAGGPVAEGVERSTATLLALARRAASGGGPLTYVCAAPADEDDPHGSVVPGLGRALAHEIPGFRAVRVEVGADTAEPALADLVAEAGRGTTEVRLTGGERRTRRWHRAEPATGGSPVGLRRGGHYVITGGAGGIGRRLAVLLADACAASVTLLGRSAAPEAVEELRERCRAAGGDLLYLRADVTDPAALAQAMAAARSRFGPPHGVVHAAGVLRDAPLADLTDAAVRDVLAPKVTGTLLLDRETAADALDFFLLMSSFVGTFGNAGQAAYCAANRVLDAFAEQRAARVARGRRHGASVSAVWPLWEDGGMRMPDAVRRLTATTTGLTAISSEEARTALRDVLALGSPTVLVARGDQRRITTALDALEPPAARADTAGPPPDAPEPGGRPADGLRPWLCALLRAEAAELVKVPVEQIAPEVEFGDYGFNSVLFTDLANRLNDRFGLALTPVAFFQHPTVDALASVLCARYRDAVIAARDSAAAPEPDQRPHAAPPVAAPEPRSAPDAAPSTPAGERGPRPVAVIGMAARLPGCPDLDTYWRQLLDGRDLVGPAPAGRFTRDAPRGGFLDDILAFDAEFFGVPPREARLMDPQQRLFLEAAWHALEDALLDPRGLAGSRTGVFVGATLSDYADHLARAAEEVGGHTITGHVQSVIANRVSYLLDLRGPSEVVDTACSSSLTALHRALCALEAGECDLAVAGGVNALFNPVWFESLGRAGLLSGSGRCWTFDERADGFVRGEGVGAVVLKPLDLALRDGDQVHGVIRGSAVGHGGRAHSLTAPRPEAQAEVVRAALRRAGVEPRTVSYVETHGTGTRLGDPIEVAGLTEAFTRSGAAVAEPWCHLGAAKTNIGHLESAAGVAGLLKVLLALRHRTLPPNAAGDRANPHLDLSGGPFTVLRETRNWEPKDPDGRPLPLRAGVSAFGFGGANAHVVVEEPPSRPVPAPADDDAGEHLLVLSAHGPDRLRAYARRLRTALTTTPHRLADLAHTSRVARTALPHRIALVAADLDQAVSGLDHYLDGRRAPGLYATESGLSDDAPDPAPPAETARRWALGEPVTLPRVPGARRVPFPGYPFDHSTAHGPVLTGGPASRPAPGAAAPARPVPSAEPAPEAERAPEPAPEAGPVPHLLARRWRPAPPPASRAPEGAATRLLLVGREAGIGLVEELAATEDVRWLVLREPSALPALCAHEFELDLDDHEGGGRLAERILASHGPLDAVIDLVDATSGPGTAREAARVALLRALAADRRGHALRLVHVRGQAGPEPDASASLPGESVAGARMAGLVRALGAEYAALRTVTVETRPGGPDDAPPGPLSLALRELDAAGSEPEVRYDGTARHVARLERLPLPASGAGGHLGAFRIRPDRPYLITGGTGGLGLAAAELLVAKGARRLVLTGRRTLPGRERWADRAPGEWWAARVAAIERLEAAGAEVMLPDTPFTDPDATGDLLTAARARFGPVAGVLHCAGSVSPTPAFVHKSYREITDCWEPKGAGLLALDRALAQDEPDFVVLYSSVCAAVPALAPGLSDYASANAVLDAYAAHAARRERVRGSRTRWIAVDWGSWSEIGMGEVTSRRYRDHGLAALTREQGLTLLDAALATGGHTSLIAVNARPEAAEALLPGPGPAPRGAPATEPGPSADAAQAAGRQDTLVERCAAHITDVLARELGLEHGRVTPDARFSDLGVDSILIAAIVTGLETLAGAPLEPSVILEHPTVSRLSRYLVEHHPDGLARWDRGRSTAPAADRTPPTVGAAEAAEPAGAVPATARRPEPDVLPLAVVGLAGRFPGAPTTEHFWDLLRHGRSGVREVPRSRWDIATLYAPEYREGRSISKWGGFLDGIEDFDPGYFGIPEADAAHMDPLTRLFLETAEELFADAGYRPEEIAGRRVGVFVGSGTSTYGSRIAVPGRATATGTNQNFIGAHLAHFRDLRGPNLVVDTACSSSLTSLCLAHQALRTGECEMAVVGGADLILDETPYLSLSAARALAPDGTCRVFDASASGFVPGEGVGAVLVRPLDAALRDGDRVLAVIEGTAMNNDGRTMGLTTPNPDAQREVIRSALHRAGASAGSVSYVEAHGTGTMIGDPIELRALTEVFREDTADTGFCGVGSVKSNVGHLLMAAGMAGLHKVILSLVHEALPPTLHCERPNPRFSFDASPFRPQTELAPWHPRHGVRRAGISAFGFGGTNCHVVLRGVTDAERAGREIRRAPLPAPVFRRARHWLQRPPAAPPAPTPGPRPLLQLEEWI